MSLKLVGLQVRLPTLRNDIIEDILHLILCEVLNGSKWQKLIEIIVEFVPPGVKLTDRPVTSEGTRGCAYTISVWKADCLWGIHVPYCTETLNMSIFHFFFLFCCFVFEDTKSLTLK
jgi:hypothetical protein